MSEVRWSLKGHSFTNCNCAYGCPCQFNALPTHGNCEAVVGFQVDRGRHGETNLDGLRAAGVFRWPGAIHEGGGEGVVIIDERANPEQREALRRILYGEDTKPGATIFQVLGAMIVKRHDPIFAPIEFDMDVNERSARLKVDNVVDARGEPILNPVTGEKHRARIEIPEGFEYAVAEVGRGWSSMKQPIAIEFGDSHAHFAELHFTESGIVR
jgi:hypothetical protein